jgi:hypothetical protein
MTSDVANQLLLLRVDGDYGNAALDAALGLRVDVLELCVAIRMLRSLDGLVGRLEAVAVLAQKLRHRLVADPNTLREQLCGERVRTLACPPQRRLRVAASDGVDEFLERGPNLRMRDVVRTLSSEGRAPARASSRPLRTVLIAMLVARATAAIPPYPRAPASVPAQRRRARSSIVAFNKRHFWRTTFSASTADVETSWCGHARRGGARV